MRTFKDAKTMAKSLRDSLIARKVSLSHSECLEIVATVAGFSNWNTLSATLQAKSAQAVHSDDRNGLHTSAHEGICKLPQTAATEQLPCSFCGNSKARSLIEGGCTRDVDAPRSCVFICDECVTLCAQVNADHFGNDAKPERSDTQ